VQKRKQVGKDADKLDRERARLGAKVEQIIREQEAVIKAAEKGIQTINSDLKALRWRLKVYQTRKPRELDDTYYNLKTRYENKLQERAALERAHEMAAESITAAKLHMIPGE
jgi:chromosome segregation ATPase